MLGDASGYDQISSDLPWLVWIVYLIITILLTIIALNLLISIIGDSYRKIVEIEENANTYEKLRIIMGYEKENTSQDSKNEFLYLVGPKNSFAKKNMRNTKEDILKLSNWEINEKFADKLNENDRKITELDQKISELDRKISQNEKTQMEILMILKEKKI